MQYSSEPSGSLKPTEERKPCLPDFVRQWQPIFYVTLAFLLAIFGLSCWSLGMSAAEYRVYSKRFEESKTALLITNAATATDEEAIFLSLGGACTTVCQAVDDALDALAKKPGSSKIPMDEVRANIEKGRQGYTTNSAVIAPISYYNRATFILTSALTELMAEQADEGYASQIGLVCIIQQILPLYSRNALQYPALLAEWTEVELSVYAGTQYSAYTFPSCEPYLRYIPEIDYAAIAAKSPSVVGQPNVGVGSPIPAMDTAMFNQAASDITQQAVSYITQTKAYWERDRNKLEAIIGLSTVTAVLSLVAMIGMLRFIRAHATKSNTLAAEEYSRIDSKVKLFPQFAHFISTLKNEGHLHAFLQDSFLRKIEGFVDRARPLIPPTCFGDVEHLTFSDVGDPSQMRDNDSTTGGGGFGNNDAAGVPAYNGGRGGNGGLEDEHRLQELRSEMGLQVVSGTYMCVAVGDDVVARGGGDCSAGEEQRRAVSNHFETLIAAIEEVAGDRRGVVHSVSGDYIFVTWNVVCPCPNSEVNGFLSAVELAERFRRMRYGRSGNLSISLSSTPAIAGNLDANGHRTSVVLGLGQAQCEKLEVFNYYLSTSIVMDEAIATKLGAMGMPVPDACIVPVALYRCTSGTERGAFSTAYALLSVSVQDYHREWLTVFREFPSMLLDSRIDEMITSIVTYKDTHLSRVAEKTKKRESATRGGVSGTGQDMMPVVEYWLMFLNTVKVRVHGGTTAASQALGFTAT